MENGKAQNMFNRIAGRYDLLNHLLSLGIDRNWRRKLVRGVVASQPNSILDVATGTADVAISLAQKLPQAEIVGIDLSENMLQIGRAKATKYSVNISLKVDNGEALSFADNNFDVLTVAFGIRNFADSKAGLQEFARVLHRGGTVHILEFSTPPRGFFAWAYRLYFHTIVPAVGGAISGDRHAYDYLPQSVDGFPAPKKFVELMTEAGFLECRARRLTGGIAYIYTGRTPN